MRDFHDLKVWGKAHQLVLAVYKCSIGFPRMLASLIQKLKAVS